MTDPDYRYVRSLGKGAFGSVISAQNRQGDRVAIKQNSIPQSMSGIGSLREVALWKTSSHPFVVELKDVVCENPVSRRLVIRAPIGMKADSSYLVMEQGQKSLARYRFSSPEDLKHFLKCILLALESMHASKIVHRDVRPENILKVGSDFKLCDMGLASVYSLLEFETVPTSNHYMPPEIAQNRDSNLSIDIWSVAVVTLELLFGTSFLNVTMSTPRAVILKNICTQLQNLRKWMNHAWISEPLRELLKGMLEFKPENRWSATQCLNSRFFRSEGTIVRHLTSVDAEVHQFSPEKIPIHGLQIFRHFWEENYSWCTPRMLVHALMMYSRYLSTETSAHQSQRVSEIQAFAVIYIAIKIWSFEFSSSFSEIVFPDLDQGDLEEIFVEFERDLCRILEWKLYVPTVFETSREWSSVQSFLSSTLQAQ